MHSAPVRRGAAARAMQTPGPATAAVSQHDTKGPVDVTAEDLALSLTTYGAGLQAELALLHQLEALALAQHDASTANALDRLTSIGDERARVMAALVQIEHDIKPVREKIAAHVAFARRLPFFDDVLARHRQAGELVSRILESDRVVLGQLEEAERARREAAHTIEAGEATLAAYRRVIAPTVASVGLVDRRG